MVNSSTAASRPVNPPPDPVPVSGTGALQDREQLGCSGLDHLGRFELVDRSVGVDLDLDLDLLALRRVQPGDLGPVVQYP
jgi:hypothetical protein